MTSNTKSDLARAELTPLARGERPRVVTVAAVIAVALAFAATLPYLFGATPIEGTSLVTTVPLAALLLVAAIGLWRVRYWAVLGFQAYLALQMIALSIALVVSNTWLATVVMIALIIAAGALFWQLVKTMARIQLTELES